MQVIGIAGTDEKCRHVEKIGADVCVNYRKDTFKQDLINATEGFADVYFGVLHPNPNYDCCISDF